MSDSDLVYPAPKGWKPGILWPSVGWAEKRKGIRPDEKKWLKVWTDLDHELNLDGDGVREVLITGFACNNPFDMAFTLHVRFEGLPGWHHNVFEALKGCRPRYVGIQTVKTPPKSLFRCWPKPPPMPTMVFYREPPKSDRLAPYPRKRR